MTLRAIAASEGTRELQKNEIVLVDLTNFDVQIGVTKDNGIQIFEVADIVTRWMNDVFGNCLANGGWAVDTYAQFDTIILLQRTDRRLQEETDEEGDGAQENPRIGELYTAEFKGAALFTKKDGQTRVPATAVYDCQRITNLEDDLLLDSFQSSGAVGLGTSVVDVQAYVNLNSGTNSADSSDSSLELVIIVAIVIACVAFMFLIFALFWAWTYDRRNRQAFLTEHRKAAERTFDANDSPEAQKERPKDAPEAMPPAYPSVIGGESHGEGGVYPESVISEDIHSSLSQYYAGGTSGNYNYASGRLQDAASVSSMESYGYSLDGYTPSLAKPNAKAHKSLPTEPANTEAWKDTKDMRETEDSANEWGISNDYTFKMQSVLPQDDDDDTHPMDERVLPMDENEMPPPSDIEDMSMMDTTMAEESCIHTAVMTVDQR
mmetsp:Transcript_16175/g.30801  ORF Transcript_16175/g.30801 Transcript_16175/m.30801 type:complete len:434 (+) Transcript_16175:255-1556(+)